MLRPIADRHLDRRHARHPCRPSSSPHLGRQWARAACCGSSPAARSATRPTERRRLGAGRPRRPFRDHGLHGGRLHAGRAALPGPAAPPDPAGLAYGVLLWLIMYWVVRPLRWPDMPLPHTLYGIANALFSHCILVGIPIAWSRAAISGAGAASPDRPIPAAAKPRRPRKAFPTRDERPGHGGFSRIVQQCVGTGRYPPEESIS